MSRSQPLARNMVWFSLAAYFAQPIVLLSSLGVKVFLGPYGAGLVSLIGVILLYGNLANLGVLLALERELPINRGADRPKQLKILEDVGFSVGMLCLAIVGIGIVLLTTLIQWSALVKQALLASAILLVAQQASNHYTTMLRTDRRFVTLAKAQVSLNTLSAGGVVIGAAVFGIPGALWAITIAGSLGAAAMLIASGRRLRVHWDRSVAIHLVRSGLSLMIVGITILALRSIDNVLVLQFLGVTSLGLYSLSQLGFGVVIAVTTACATVVYPEMGVEWGRSGSKEALAEITQYWSRLLAVSLPVVTGVIYLVMPAIVEVGLRRFASGIPCFRVVVLGSAMFGLSQVVTSELFVRGKNLAIGLTAAGATICATMAVIILHATGHLTLVAVGYAIVSGYAVAWVVLTALAHERRAAGSLLLREVMLLGYGSICAVGARYGAATLGTRRLSAGAVGLAIFVFLYGPVVLRILAQHWGWRQVRLQIDSARSR